MARLGDRRQVTDNFLPAVAEIIGAEYVAGGGCRKDRRRVACFLQTESFDTCLQAVGQAVAQNFPTASAILAARDARAGEVSRAPGSGRVMRRGHQNQFRIRRTKHETIRVAPDFIFSPRPLFPTVATIGADVESAPCDAI